MLGPRQRGGREQGRLETSRHGELVEGRHDYRAINPHTWYHAWGGRGEGVRPRTVMGAFLVHAWLFNAPPQRIAETRDIPWCRADLYYLRKLVVAIEASR